MRIIFYISSENLQFVEYVIYSARDLSYFIRICQGYIVLPYSMFGLVCFMVFYANFNNISFISWLSILLLEETRENHRPVASHCHTLSYNVVLSTLCQERGSKLKTLVVIGTDCTGIYNPHTIWSRPQRPRVWYVQIKWI